MESAELFRRFFAHHRWASRKLMSELELCERTELETANFEGAASPIQTLRHMLQSESYWIALFVRGDGAMDAARVFEPLRTVDEMRSAWEAAIVELDAYFARLDGAELERQFTVTFPGGEPFSPRVNEVLSQLTVHSSQHRSELALLAGSATG